LKNKKIWFLIIVNIIFILLTLFVSFIFSHQNELVSEVITETDYGSTTIHIYSSNSLEMALKYSLLIITFDLLFFTVFYIKCFKKMNYIIIIICALNILLSILLFPFIVFLAVIVDIIIIGILLINKIRNKKQKTST